MNFAAIASSSKVCCQGCDCFKITPESPLRSKFLDAVSVKRRVHASLHAASATFILFSLSAYSRQVVFIEWF
jgi:hypothetical protein